MIHDLQPSIYGHVSTFWQGILKATMAFFVSRIEIEIGDGRSTQFWLDHWVSYEILAMKFPNHFGLALDPSQRWIAKLNLIYPEFYIKLQIWIGLQLVGVLIAEYDWQNDRIENSGQHKEL